MPVPEVIAIGGVDSRDDEDPARAIGPSHDRIAMPGECRDGARKAGGDASGGRDEQNEGAFHRELQCLLSRRRREGGRGWAALIPRYLLGALQGRNTLV